MQHHPDKLITVLTSCVKVMYSEEKLTSFINIAAEYSSKSGTLACCLTLALQKEEDVASETLMH